MDNNQFQSQSYSLKGFNFTISNNRRNNRIYIIVLLFLFQIFVFEGVFANGNEVKEIDRLLKQASSIMKTDIEKSLKYADSALKISIKLNDSKNQIRSLKVLMEIYYEKKDHKNGLDSGIKLLNAEKKLNISNPTTVSYLGEICLDMGLFAKSLSYYKQALVGLKSKEKESEKADVLINVGIVYGHLGDYKNELKSYLDSYKVLKFTNSNEQLSTLLNNIGTVYGALKDINRSLEFYNKAYSLSKDVKDKSGEAVALANIAGTYLERKNYKDALKSFKQSLEISKSINDKAGISYSLSGLSECYMGMKSFKQAVKYANDALVISIDAGEKMEIAENYLVLSEVYLKIGKPEESLKSLKNAEKIGNELKTLPLLLTIYESFADYYKEVKDYKMAMGFLQKFIKFNEKIYNKDSRNKTIAMQTMYETLQKDHQIKLLNKDKYLREIELNRQQLIKNGFISAIIIIIIFSFLIYNRYRLKKKAHMVLEMAHNGLEAANQIIIEKNKHITDSINYAKNIQLAILPLETKITNFIKEYFIFYKPKDIVSGDFYWFNEVDDKVYLAVVDCTGHGVPGAFMSMIGYSLLNQILLETKIYDPAGILDALSSAVRDILRQDQDGIKTNDGMDVCLCCLNIKEKTLTYAGARRPIFYIKKEDIDTANPSIIEIKGTRRSVGGSRVPERRKFMNNEIKIEPGDVFYLTSDGYADQSSPEGVKFSSSSLRTLLAKISSYDMAEQEGKISSSLKLHQKSEEQRDDITIFGFKVS